jgi:hypothetical protein
MVLAEEPAIETQHRLPEGHGEAAKAITERTAPDSNIIFGANIDDKLRDKIKITVIATGFDSTRPYLYQKKTVPQNDIQINNLNQQSRSDSSYQPPSIFSSDSKPKIESVRTDTQYPSQSRSESQFSKPEPVAQFPSVDITPIKQALGSDELPSGVNIDDEYDIPAFLRNKK